MGGVRHEIRIGASADDVWAVVGRPELLHLWFPGITSSTVATANGVTTRTITTAQGMVMPEEILANDRLLRRFQYRITTPVFQWHRGTIDVIALAGDECLVVYSTDAEPSVMALVIGGGTLGALRELQRQFTEGGPAVEAVREAQHT